MYGGFILSSYSMNALLSEPFDSSSFDTISDTFGTNHKVA